MIVLFDTSTLAYLFIPDAPGPFVKGSDQRLPDCDVRISYLLAELQKAKATIVIPTPVIAELMTVAGGASQKWLQILTGSKHFRPAPFDVLAAVECSEMAKQRAGARKPRTLKDKAKFDEQIVAICRVEGATIIYSDDSDIQKLAGDAIQVIGMAGMPLPPTEAQGTLALEPGDEPDAPPADDNEP